VAREKLEQQRVMAVKNRKGSRRTDVPQGQNLAAYLHKYS
jgi:hypothetical protein